MQRKPQLIWMMTVIPLKIASSLQRLFELLWELKMDTSCASFTNGDYGKCKPAHLSSTSDSLDSISYLSLHTFVEKYYSF